jgi:lipid II:glycine glycyltransferase (peptidoglycan interpeptide bridge formation enzyme)
VIEEQPLASEVQDPTPVQELQQLQAQLQSMQQVRDRVATAFTASQQAAQTSTQVEEIRQQLAFLQVEIQSMQPPQHLFGISH